LRAENWLPVPSRQRMILRSGAIGAPGAPTGGVGKGVEDRADMMGLKIWLVGQFRDFEGGWACEVDVERAVS
jgi:hypothetical protein